LRKGVKIKVISIFICWLIILAHNIIPHNHHEDSGLGLHEPSHYEALAQGTSETGPEFHGLRDDEEACHFSGLLFHNLSQDNLTVNDADNRIWNPVLRPARLIVTGEILIYRNNFFGAASLRAPPRG